MYWKIFGKYTYEKYHEANEEKRKDYGSVVREEVMWNFPLIHIFDSKVIILLSPRLNLVLTETTTPPITCLVSNERYGKNKTFTLVLWH